MSGSRSAVPILPGVTLWPGYFDHAAQEALLSEVLARTARAPFYRPRMPRSGKRFSVEETNFGPLGWYSDETGYRYEATHPATKLAWPDIPELLDRMWYAVGEYPAPAECCLVNRYRDGARMGLHQDRDEADFSAPVVSLSLGDTCLFRIGGTKRGDPTRSLTLASGDVLVLGGEARLAFHGVDRIMSGTSTLLPEGGRINLTLRWVTRPA